MNSKLLSELVDQGFVDTNTKVHAYLKIKIFGGGTARVLKEMSWHPTIPAADITSIEGMDPERFAASYDIKPDGEKKVYKRRGRKPKDQTIANA